MAHLLAPIGLQKGQFPAAWFGGSGSPRDQCTTCSYSFSTRTAQNQKFSNRFFGCCDHPQLFSIICTACFRPSLCAFSPHLPSVFEVVNGKSGVASFHGMGYVAICSCIGRSYIVMRCIALWCLALRCDPETAGFYAAIDHVPSVVRLQDGRAHQKILSGWRIFIEHAWWT